MAKKGIKIKELAQELGVTSRQLIDRCRAEGILVQNSITKLPEAQAVRVRNLFSKTAPEPDSVPLQESPTGKSVPHDTGQVAWP